ncbi:MBG domain-containing protein [uncultured Polaribacter sp.]|uniref:MBG domain-containing protein n=1 Tax=uncultured Polaribacter sp. TaxID=174711 RepID=UPI0026018E51|nr:MBG domain-containing protein [uncultured Polaribacter sp.]
MIPKSKSKWYLVPFIILFISLNSSSQNCVNYTVNPATTITTTGGIIYNTIINVPLDFAISDINVSLDITHSWNSDLSIFLISPSNTRIELSTSNGGNGDNYTNVILDDDSTNTFVNANATLTNYNITGTYKPEGLLSDFNNENANGNWVLEITDTQNDDGGIINSVSLEICSSEIDRDSFENSLEGWSQSAGDIFDWINKENNTPSAGTGPQSGGSEGTWFMYIEASSPRATGDNAFLEKSYDFTNQINSAISFDYHMYTDKVNSMGTLNVLVSSNGGAFTEVFTKSGNQGIDWLAANIDLSIYDGENIIVRFEAIVGAGTIWSSDIAIDNVIVSGFNATPKIEITVTADTKNKSIGDTEPALTYTITSGNLESGDSLVGSLTRTPGEAVGGYNINQGTLVNDNNPKYNITFISALFTIEDKDTDGDGYGDSTDVDDDNDGILDTDENCVIPGASEPQLDQISYNTNGYSIYAVGGNTNSGLGFQESGFQSDAFSRGLTLNRLNGATDFSSLPPAPGTNGTAGSTTGTWTNGTLSYITTAANPTTRRNQFRNTTGSEFISGTGGDAIYIKPSINLIQGEDYTVSIGFTTPVYAFNFDLIDILDTFIDSTDLIIKYEIYANSELVAYFQSNFIGNDATATVDVFDVNGVSQGTMLIGNNVETSIGFISENSISNVSIVHKVINGAITDNRADLHALDNFVWSTQTQSCFADDLDFDKDGLNNDKDLDSDNDGIPDNIEAQTTIDYRAPNYMYTANGLDTAYSVGLIAVNSDESGNADYVALDADGDTIFDTVEVGFTIDTDNDGMTDGIVGENGLDNSLYTADDYNDVNTNIDDPKLLPDADSDVLTIGDVDYRDNHVSGTPMITQFYIEGTSRVIEITNIDTNYSILANTIELGLFKDKSGIQTGIVPDNSYTIPVALAAGESILITNAAATFSGVVNDDITSLIGANDILVLSNPKSIADGTNDWKNRYESSFNLENDKIYVRNDEIITTNKDFSLSEWVVFVNEDLDPYRDESFGGPERHPHDPVISEIASADATSNLSLGVHQVNPTVRIGGTWSNGFPDRTRSVVIDEDFSTSSIVKAKTLTINTGNKLTINNNLLVVSEDIIFESATSEIRLAAGAQLIQTHTATTKVSGAGNLYVDQDSPTASKYRYNYMSSPVGGSSFTLQNVLKDGTAATSATSTPLDINFVSGYDGDETSSPIKIADYWIYTYASGDGKRSNWTQKKSIGSIPVTDGFTLKGPGIAQNYTFVGTPNDGNLTTAIGGNESYLVGNPFPSAISAKKFIEDNMDAIDGTLYFWQHAGEEDLSSTVTAGHSYNGYIGGYGTRNISMGIAANSAALAGAFNITLEAVNATVIGTVLTDLTLNTVLLDSNTDLVVFNAIPKAIDILKITYRSLAPKNIRLKINGNTVEDFTLPASLTYTTFDISKCIEQNSDISIVSLDDVVFYLNAINLQDDDGEISCVPNANGVASFSYTSPLDYIAIGQGFFISGDADGGAITFNNSQRENIIEGSASTFFKSNKEHKKAAEKRKKLPILKLGMNYTGMEGNELHRQIGISFKSNNSFNYEAGYDSYLFDLSSTDFYWKFPNMDEKYAIAGIQNISEDLEIPLEIIVAEEDEISIEIDEISFKNSNIFILDKVENKYYNLKEEKAKILLNKGEYKDRFFLTFKQTTVLGTANDVVSNNIGVFYNKENKEIDINITDNLIVDKVEMYSILGQQINAWKFDKNQKEHLKIKVSNLSKAVYIVKINTDKGVISKKILIE